MTKPKPRSGTRKITTVETVPVNEDELSEGQISELDVSLEQAIDLQTLNDVLAQYGVEEGINFKIFKIVDGIQRYQFEHPTLDESYIQQQRGGGNYVARLFISGKYKKSIPVSIDDLPEDQQKHTNGNSNARSHEQFLERMLMALIMKENGGGGTAPSLADMTTALANLDSLRGKQENTLETFIKGLEMADRFGGGNGGKLDWKKELFDLAKDNAPAIMYAVNTGLASKNGNPAPPPPVPSAVVEQPANPVQEPTAEQQEQQMSFMLRSAIGMLKNQFTGGLDVESALRLALANASNPQYAPVIQEFASREFDDLVKLDAQIGREPFESRFRALHDGLRQALSGDDNVGDDTGRDDGDHDDPRPHGNVSTSRGK